MSELMPQVSYSNWKRLQNLKELILSNTILSKRMCGHMKVDAIEDKCDQDSQYGSIQSK